MTTSNDDLRPDLKTLRILDDGDSRLRIYLTVGGAIACERFDPKSKTWKLLPLREASEQDISDMLAVRYASHDEEVARAVAAHNR